MFGGTRLRVVNSHEKNTFGYIHTKYSTSSEQAQCVQFYWREQKLYLWIVCTNVVAENTIAINPTHRGLLQIPEGVEIFITPCNNINVLKQIEVVPDSPDDQEILEQNAEVLQLRLLDQIRLVAKDQKTLVWIYSSMPIIFTPSDTGILVNHSEVIVKLDNFIFKSSKTPNNKKIIEDNDLKFNNIGLMINDLLNPYYNVLQPKSVLRVLKIRENHLEKQRKCIHPFIVFVHEDLIPDKVKDRPNILAVIDVLESKIENKSKEQVEQNITSKPNFKNLLIQVIVIDKTIFKSLSNEYYNENIPTVLMVNSLCAFLNIENGCKVELNYLLKPPEDINEVEIKYSTTHDNIGETIVDNFKQFILQSKEMFILNSGFIYVNNKITKIPIQFNIKNSKQPYGIVTNESLRDISLSVKPKETEEEVYRAKAPGILEMETKDVCREIDSFEEIVKRCKILLEFEKHREANFHHVSGCKGNILITGISGSGKTLLCDIICKESLVYSCIVPCRPLKGRKDVADILEKVLHDCHRKSPSVLICDDIDALTIANTEGIASQDVAYYERLAQSIKTMLRTTKGVSVIMTATSTQALHPILRIVSAEPLYTEHFTINELNQEERYNLLKHLLNENVKKQFTFDSEDIKQLSTETSGYTARDIEDHVNKLIYKAIKHKISGETKPKLIEKADKNISEDPFDIFGNVGGMEGVKQEITEKIFWPVLYPSLFPSQACGVLLFGPPGMGKTYIGSCLARLTNMAFISVKGPELLSKYIGQSEKAIRDIFDKADAKKPCILFFDEFDSIAPKRGHDSTGVTDRVVNQFLARLDGAEGGAKGPVIAATSRPDLIDPALLRPGRLDQHIYCPAPDQTDRHDILVKISNSMSLAEEVDLASIAERTKGFSPADLKSILVTAQLSAVDRCVSSGEDVEQVTVTGSDLENALLETKPSLSRDQLMFYNVIYKRFRGEKPSQQELKYIGPQKQRVTLA